MSKMNAVKEVTFCKYLGATIESEHGKIEMLFSTFSDGSRDELKAFTFNFHGDIFEITEESIGDIKNYEVRMLLRNIATGYYFLSYNSYDLAMEMCERAELLQLMGSALAYLAL